jgi:hypothetical protein
MLDPNARLWRIRRELDEISERIDRQVRRIRREGCCGSRSKLQAVESLRHKRDTLLIRFWLLDRHGEARWHRLQTEIEEAWSDLREEWLRASGQEGTPAVTNVPDLTN